MHRLKTVVSPVAVGLRRALSLKLVAAFAVSTACAQTPQVRAPQVRAPQVRSPQADSGSAPSRMPSMDTEAYHRYLQGNSSMAPGAMIRTVAATTPATAQSDSPQLRKLAVPAIHAEAIANALRSEDYAVSVLNINELF